MPDPAPSSPQLLATLAARADPVAWAELVHRHGAAMYRSALAVARHAERADDAVQEALLHVRLRAGSFRDPGDDGEVAVRRWLQRLASNAAASLLTADRRRRGREDVAARSAPTEVAMERPDQGSTVVAEALASLSSADRQVILFRYVDGLEHRALAQAVGCGEGSVRMRLHRAQERLRRRLERAGITAGIAVLAGSLSAVEGGGAPPDAVAGWIGLLASPRTPVLPFRQLQGGTSFAAGIGVACALVVIAAALVMLRPEVDEPAAVPQPLVATSREEPPPQPAAEPAAPAVDDAAARAAAVEAVMSFACDSYARLAPTPGNLFFSPQSLEAALTMTMAGARGGTLAEMRKVLRHRLADADVHRGMGLLEAALVPGSDDEGQPLFMLSSANRLWGQGDYTTEHGFRFRQDFLALLDRDYGARMEVLDFARSPEPSRQVINRWVADRTNGRIPDLIAPGGITAATRSVLTNAVHFKAAWLDHGFLKAGTRPEPFAAPGGAIQVAMMHRLWRTAYYQGVGFQVVRLLFSGAEVELLLLVPTDADPSAAEGLRALEAQLTPARFATWMAGLSDMLVDLSLPRLRVEMGREMGEDLAAAGMPTAFTPAADFSGMQEGHEPFWIGGVIHRAVLAVDEDGAEAAAATGVRWGAGKVKKGSERAVVRCDRPFLLLLRHVSTGAWLFLGRISEPPAAAGEQAPQAE